MTLFFRLTVHARAAVIVFFVAFVLLDLAPPILILFGASISWLRSGPHGL